MKLEGIRVVDLTSFLPGPYLTLALADHGADVTKVEAPPDGDPARHHGAKDGTHAAYFRLLNRGKKSVVLDLKTPAGLDSLLAMVDQADVFVESLRPGAAGRLGLGYEALRQRNPGLVYCSISAFGQDSPYGGRPAHDLALEAMSGALSLTLDADDKPVVPGMPATDVLAALNGLSGVLMALLRRKDTGVGDHVDVSMHESAVSALLNVLGPPIVENRQPVAKHERTTGGAAFYRLYETKDGRHLGLAGQEPKFVKSLLEALGRLDLMPPCLAGPGPHQRPVMAFLEETFRSRTLAEWKAFLAPLDLCWGPVNTLPEALADESLHARGMVFKDGQGRLTVGTPIRFRNEPAILDLREPLLGEH